MVWYSFWSNAEGTQWGRLCWWSASQSSQSFGHNSSQLFHWLLREAQAKVPNSFGQGSQPKSQIVYDQLPDVLSGSQRIRIFKPLSFESKTEITGNYSQSKHCHLLANQRPPSVDHHKKHGLSVALHRPMLLTRVLNDAI